MIGGQPKHAGGCLASCLIVLATLISARPAFAEDAAAAAPQRESHAAHFQVTATDQTTFKFPSAYDGPQSLFAGNYGRETSDATAFLGAGGLSGFEFWIDLEIDQGYGLSAGHGAAGIPNGESARLNSSSPYVMLPQIFARKTINLGGEIEQVPGDQNQLAQVVTANRLTFTIGKTSVSSIFDANSYAHDPRGDFFNGALMDTATLDYAGDANSETYGAVAEWRQGRFTGRLGVFDMAKTPGSAHLDSGFGQIQTVAELEERHTVHGLSGKLVLTAFYDRARIAAFSDAIAAGADGAPDLASARRYRGKGGVAANGEQQLSADTAVFFRAGFQDGRYESFGFTDADQTLAVGVSLTGARWKRANDKIGLAVVLDQASKDRLDFLAHGGMGLVIGDGRLVHSGVEQIAEAYYSVAIKGALVLSLDAQLIVNPGYNRDRGPAPLLGVRIHDQF
jgi:high affinity Mn2+ porin